MRVLFTGADGYIGAILGPKLLASGHDAIGVLMLDSIGAAGFSTIV